MQQSPLFPSPADLNTMYWELLRHPDFVLQLTAYQKSKLREYAEGIECSAWDGAEFLVLKRPNYNYPSEYRNGREMEYFFERMSTAQDSRRALQLLAENPVAPQIAETIPTVSLAEVEPKATPPAAIPVDFSLYIKEEYREKLLPFLKQHYTNSKPGGLTCMLFALYDLDALTIAPMQANQRALHEALVAYFGNIGKLQSLNTSFTKHNSASSAQQLSIETHRKVIKERLAKS